MNQHQTVEKMRSMRLLGMAQVHHQNLTDNLYSDYTLDQYISLLVDQEWESRYNRKTQNLIKAAGFRATADIQNIDYTSNRGLEKNTFERLASLEFIKNKQNLIITGATGTGKSYIAQALGRKACLELYKTKYYPTHTLFDQIKLAILQGTYYKLLKKIQQTNLLIIEDFGLIQIDKEARKALMQIVEFKYEKTSLIITSQIPVKNWHQLIGEGTIADAIMDRIVHNSHRIELKGGSLRKKRKLNH